LAEEREFNSASFYQFLAEKKLMASRCKKCRALHLPPHPICTKCSGNDMEWVEMKGNGKLAAFTAVAVGPTSTIEEGYDRNNPYLRKANSVSWPLKLNRQRLKPSRGKVVRYHWSSCIGQACWLALPGARV